MLSNVEQEIPNLTRGEFDDLSVNHSVGMLNVHHAMFLSRGCAFSGSIRSWRWFSAIFSIG